MRLCALICLVLLLPGIAFAQAMEAGELHPFAAAGVAVKVGAEGVGFDFATVLNRHINLRYGASFLDYSHRLTESGIQIDPDISFRKFGVSLDYYPWRGSFRVSPGVMYNGNHAYARAMVPGGQSFELNDQTYISSATDPLHGTATLQFGRHFAPALTAGWGNIVPRSGSHFSVPLEVGFEYIGRPTLTYDLSGSACSAEGCSTVQDDPEFQRDRVAEQQELNHDLAPLRFYPVASLGLGYRF